MPERGKSAVAARRASRASGRDARSWVSSVDVARHAGVSQATVSYVLNNRRDVALTEDTRARVLAAAEALGYRPNRVSDAMFQRRTNTVGITMPTLGEFSGSLLSGAQQRFFESGFVPVTIFSGYKDGRVPDTVADEPVQLHALVEQRVQGVLFYPWSRESAHPFLMAKQRMGLPIVTVDHEVEGRPFDHVGYDNVAIGREAAAHLWDMGYRHFVYVCSDLDHSTGFERLEGFAAVLVERGFAPPRVLETYKCGPEDAARFVAALPKPCGLFAYNDMAALLAYTAARTAGVRVPDDVGLLGAGDLSYAAHLEPPLSTFRHDAYHLGWAAAELLLKRLNDPKPGPPERVLPPSPLLARASTRLHAHGEAATETSGGKTKRLRRGGSPETASS